VKINKLPLLSSPITDRKGERWKREDKEKRG
jgi:hypothetical protein